MHSKLLLAIFILFVLSPYVFLSPSSGVPDTTNQENGLNPGASNAATVPAASMNNLQAPTYNMDSNGQPVGVTTPTTFGNTNPTYPSFRVTPLTSNGLFKIDIQLYPNQPPLCLTGKFDETIALGCTSVNQVNGVPSSSNDPRNINCNINDGIVKEWLKAANINLNNPYNPTIGSSYNAPLPAGSNLGKTDQPGSTNSISDNAASQSPNTAGNAQPLSDQDPNKIKLDGTNGEVDGTQTITSSELADKSAAKKRKLGLSIFVAIAVALFVF